MLLCFGDSNTWGFTPQGGRYVAELRWPNRLASQLGVALNAQGQPGRTLIAERRELGLCSGLHAWQEALRMAPTRSEWAPCAMPPARREGPSRAPAPVARR